MVDQDRPNKQTQHSSFSQDSKALHQRAEFHQSKGTSLISQQDDRALDYKAFGRIGTKGKTAQMAVELQRLLLRQVKENRAMDESRS